MSFKFSVPLGSFKYFKFLQYLKALLKFIKFLQLLSLKSKLSMPLFSNAEFQSTIECNLFSPKFISDNCSQSINELFILTTYDKSILDKSSDFKDLQ